MVRFVAVCIAMYWVVDMFGRTKLLMGGSAVAVSHDPVIILSTWRKLKQIPF
jgi:hypothetical protein